MKDKSTKLRDRITEKVMRKSGEILYKDLRS